jgi:hypothetical protein
METQDSMKAQNHKGTSGVKRSTSSTSLVKQNTAKARQIKRQVRGPNERLRDGTLLTWLYPQKEGAEKLASKKQTARFSEQDGKIEAHRRNMTNKNTTGEKDLDNQDNAVSVRVPARTVDGETIVTNTSTATTIPMSPTGCSDTDTLTSKESVAKEPITVHKLQGSTTAANNEQKIGFKEISDDNALPSKFGTGKEKPTEMIKLQRMAAKPEKKGPPKKELRKPNQECARTSRKQRKMRCNPE